MTDRYFADCCYGTELQHPSWERCPLVALAAATVTAKTAQQAECEASQSGPKGNAKKDKS